MKIARSVFVFALIVVSALVSSAQEKDKTTGAVKGKVRVERGSPVGVTVILRRGEEEVRRVETNSKGDFTIARVMPGVYGLTLRKPGLAVASIDKLEVKAGNTRSLKDLVLSIDEGSITFLRGSVFTESGRSVPGVRVDLLIVNSETSVEKLDSRITGETGEFVFRVPPEPAKYRLSLKADDAEPFTKDVDVEAALVYRVALTYKRKPK